MFSASPELIKQRNSQTSWLKTMKVRADMMKVKVILVKVEVNMFPVDKDGKREEFS